MKDLELTARINSEITNALGYMGSEISEDRRKALDYYLGQPFGNEVDGRSQVVSRDVSDTVEWILPQLARMFMSGDDYVQFLPKEEGDEDKARQATEYCNHVLETDNDKFNIFYTWFKDALIQKNGIVKLYWDTDSYEKEEEYEHLTADELMYLVSDPDIEITGKQMLIDDGVSLREVEDDSQDINPHALYNVQVTKIAERGYPRVENIPPEDFLISRRTRDIQSAPFVAHMRKTTESELIIEGYPKSVVKDIPSGDEQAYNTEKVSRYSKDNDFPYQTEQEGSERVIWVYECYIRYDYDGDGKSELRRVISAGAGSYKILSNEKAEFIPFCSISPVPMPHKFYGLSVADLVNDLQLIKSTIWRQMLDNLYLINNGRTAVNDNVNLDDLLTSRPGGVVRMDNPQADWANMAPTDVTRSAYPMLEYCDMIRKERTGVDENITGLDPNTLQDAKTGAVNRAFEAAQMKIELIARVFAETGIKDLFRKMLRMLVKYQEKERLVYMKEQWVPMNPREWDERMEVKVNVGLGTGNKDQQAAHLKDILGLQIQGLQLGVSNPDLIYNTLSKLVNNAGYKTEKEFFQKPQPMPPHPQQQSNPLAEAEMVRAQGNLKQKEMELAYKQKIDALKMQYDDMLNKVKESNRYMIEEMKQQNENHRSAMTNEVKALIEGYKIDIGPQKGLG